MKGIGKPKGLKQSFAERLMQMVGLGNKEHKQKVKRVIEAMAPEPGKTAKHPKTKGFYTSRHHRTKPNPKRRARKTLNGEIRHLSHARGFMAAGPTLDQTKALEQRIGLKVRVKSGKCHVGDSGLILPVDVTLDEATRLLDKHLQHGKSKVMKDTAKQLDMPIIDIPLTT